MRLADPSILQGWTPDRADLTALHLSSPNSISLSPNSLETNEFKGMPPERLVRIARSWEQSARDTVAREIRKLHNDCKQRGFRWESSRLRVVKHPFEATQGAEGIESRSWESGTCLQIEDGTYHVLVQVQRIVSDEAIVPEEYGKVLGQRRVAGRVFIEPSPYPLKLLAVSESTKSSLSVDVNLTPPYYDTAFELWVQCAVRGREAGVDHGDVLQSMYSPKMIDLLAKHVRRPIAPMLSHRNGSAREPGKVEAALELARKKLSSIELELCQLSNLPPQKCQWTAQLIPIQGR